MTEETARAVRGRTWVGAQGWTRVAPWAGAALALLIAIVLFSQFSLNNTLTRDESIYTYSGQQLSHGVAPYVSIFDPKTPLSAMIAAVGVLAARAVNAGSIHVVRLEFFAFACLAVVGVYVLALWLWESLIAGIVSAVTFAAFKGFAFDALGGPDAKTPGVLFAVVSMALLVRRHWFWGAFVGSLAALVWQPLAVYPVVAVLGAAVLPDAERRWKRTRAALFGAAIPLVAAVLYFWLAGALAKFFEAAVRFPLTGVKRGHDTLGDRLDRIVKAVNVWYGDTRVLFWGGLLVLVAIAVVRLVRGRSEPRRLLGDPYLVVVMISLVVLVGFSLSDFEGYPDLYSLLPYAALGVGGAAAIAIRAASTPPVRRAVTAAALAAAALLTGLSWHWYSAHRVTDSELLLERAQAAAVERLVGPGQTLYALGDPTPLVLTGRRNPSRFIYLGSGIDHWVVDHTPGGFYGWTAKIRAADPKVVVIGGWTGLYEWAMENWLKSSYQRRQIGRWTVFVRPNRAPFS